MSTLTEKLVDFDIMVESEPRREAPAKPGQVADHTSALEESTVRLNSLLMNIKRTQKQYVSLLSQDIYVLSLLPKFPYTREQRVLLSQVNTEVGECLTSL